MKIPMFAQMEKILEQKKMFKVMGVFDLLSTLFEMESFEMKEVLFKAGEVGDKLFVVVEGCIKINSKDVANGKEVTIAMLTKNQVFGEIALLEETTRTATAIAFEPSLVLSINQEKFASLTQVFPEFYDVMEPLLRDRTSNTLKTVPLFADLKKEQRDLISEMLQVSPSAHPELRRRCERRRPTHTHTSGPELKKRCERRRHFDCKRVAQNDLLRVVDFHTAAAFVHTMFVGLCSLRVCGPQFNNYPTGMNVTNEGMKDDGLHILIDGEVVVTKQDSGGKSVELCTVQKGGVLGEISLLAGMNRSATCTALEPCRTLWMSQVNCRALFSVAPELMEQMVGLARSRRANTLEVMGEGDCNIPRIDETKESKLRLYALLRAMDAAEQEASMSSMRGEIASPTHSRKMMRQKEEKNGQGKDDFFHVKEKNAELRLEGQFLEIQIIDLLSAINMLEAHERALGGGSPRIDDDPLKRGSNCVEIRTMRRNSWPKSKHMEKVHGVLADELVREGGAGEKKKVNAVKHKRGSVAKRLSNVNVTQKQLAQLTDGHQKKKGGSIGGGGMKAPMHMDEEANGEDEGQEATYPEKRGSMKFENDEAYSAVAMAAIFSGDAHAETEAALSEEDSMNGGGGGKNGRKKPARRKSAPNSYEGSGGSRRRSFVDAERAKHEADKKKMAEEKKRKERPSLDEEAKV